MSTGTHILCTRMSGHTSFVLQLLVFVFFGGEASPVLTTFPKAPTDGELFTMMCNFVQVDNPPNSVTTWYIGINAVVNTGETCNDFTPRLALNFTHILEGRFNVSCSETQHNVTLRVNSTIDHGTRWYCGRNSTISNIFELDFNATISPPMSTPISSTIVTQTDTTSTQSPSLTYSSISLGSEDQVPVSIIVGVTVGLVTVLVVVLVVVCTYVYRHRRNKQVVQSPAQEENNVYNTLSRDPGTDNHYTGLKRFNLVSDSEEMIIASQKQVTINDVYYNTAPRDGTYYENPGLSSERKEKTNAAHTTLDTCVNDAYTTMPADNQTK